MNTSDQAPIIVYSFGNAWGFPAPTSSPFGLKLVTWLRMHDVAHELRVENNPGKGPKGKCPWAVVNGEAMGDSELVIQRLKKERRITGDAALTDEQRAIGTATRLMLEEHYHQVWEHQLFIHEGGWNRGKEFWDQLPPVLSKIIRSVARSALRKQLHARGVGRHDQAQIAKMGILDLHTVESLLGDKPYFLGDEPTEVDATVFAFLAVTHWTPVESPVWDYYHSRPRLEAYSERMLKRYFRGDGG